MLNKVAKLSLVSTSLAPICLTLWFVEINKAWDDKATFQSNIVDHCTIGIGYLLVALILGFLCWGVISLSKSKYGLEKLPVKIISVKTVDKEIVGFLLVYLLPLINQTNSSISIPVLIFIAVIFFFIVLNSHAYHFNPLLGVFGYHFYEVAVEGNITYVLITRQNIADCKNITHIVQLTEYMILETPRA